MSNYDTIAQIITSFSGSERSVVIPKTYLEITGDYPTAALLNQLVFWSDKSKRKDGYFYKKYDEWHDELLLSDYQIRRITKKLEEMNFITTALKKANGTPTKHYKINMEEIQKAIMKKLNNGNLRNLTIDSKETKESLTYDYNSKLQHINTNSSSGQATTPPPPYKEIIDYLNEKTGKNFSHTAKGNKKLISGRFNDGNSLEVFKYVIDVKVADWLDDTGMKTYLKPETLFNSSNFDKYKNETIEEVQVRKQHWNKVKNNKQQQLQGQDLLDAMQTDEYWGF